ncbi:MAG: NAD(P)-dependent oxidoreductase [Candidatus Shapirobacteria bacterium]|jgi:nucleoside-diphosphate-sugar epimerase
MRIFVTGATGGVGKKVMEMLIGEGFECVALFRDEKKQFLRDRINWIEGDILNLPERTKKEINQCDVVIHMAAKLGLNHPDCIKINVEGMKKLIEAIEQDKKINIVYFSSIDAYGSTGAEGARPGDAPHPDNVYGWSKLGAEEELQKGQKNHKNLSYVILRIGNLTGAGDEDLVTSMKKLAENRKAYISWIRSIFWEDEINETNIYSLNEVIKGLIKNNKLDNKIKYVTGRNLSFRLLGCLSREPRWFLKFLRKATGLLMRFLNKGGFFLYLVQGKDSVTYRRYPDGALS